MPRHTAIIQPQPETREALHFIFYEDFLGTPLAAMNKLIRFLQRENGFLFPVKNETLQCLDDIRTFSPPIPVNASRDFEMFLRENSDLHAMAKEACHTIDGLIRSHHDTNLPLQKYKWYNMF